MGSEMCIRDSVYPTRRKGGAIYNYATHAIGGYRIWLRLRPVLNACLLYTSDAADDLLCVDLGGRRIIKKKK